MSNLRLATSNPIAVLAEVFGFSNVEAAMNRSGFSPSLKVKGLALAHLVSGIWYLVSGIWYLRLQKITRTGSLAHLYGKGLSISLAKKYSCGAQAGLLEVIGFELHKPRVPWRIKWIKSQFNQPKPD